LRIIFVVEIPAFILPFVILFFDVIVKGNGRKDIPLFVYQLEFYIDSKGLTTM